MCLVNMLCNQLDLLATTNNIDKVIVETLMVKLSNKYVELRNATCRQFLLG